VAEHGQRHAGVTRRRDERRERAIDHHAVEMRVEFGVARFEQADLLRHAIARTDLAALPGLLQRLPARSPEALEQGVGDVLDGDRAVEVTEDGPVGHGWLPAARRRTATVAA